MREAEDVEGLMLRGALAPFPDRVKATKRDQRQLLWMQAQP